MKNTTVVLAICGMLACGVGMTVQAGVGLNWATPSGLVRADGATPLLETGAALFQVVFSYDPVADPPLAGGGVSGDDLLLAEQVADSSTASSYGQHFAATFVDAGWSTPGFVYVRVFDAGTSPGNVPPDTAYFDGELVAVSTAWAFPSTYQEIAEGSFAAGLSVDGMGRYVLDQQVGGGGGAPSLDILNSSATVANGVAEMMISGTSENLVGLISWSNSLIGHSGTLGATPSWDFMATLGVGNNVIVVSGTNGSGQVAYDSVEIYRVQLPWLVVTNSDAEVPYSVTEVTVGGLCGDGVEWVNWENNLTGASGSVPAINSFLIEGISLNVGANGIYVSTGNQYGDSVYDSVTIIRAAVAAEAYLDITNANETVENSVAEATIGGVSSNLVGDLRWTNSLSGLTGTLVAAPSWSFACPLAVGSNPITVWGTNSAGQVASDEVTILRTDPQGEVIIFQPGPGLNDGSDDGRVSAGKDANGGNCNGPGSNEGAEAYLYADPISDCNPCHSKIFLQFNLDTLPTDVTAVYLGFTHIPQTDYCLSNCEADFQFYPLTGPWNEMTVNLDNQPARGNPIHGPVHRAFPNDPGTQEYEITEIYRQWKNGTTPNHGLEISSETIGCNNAPVAFYVHSSDAADPGQRPYLRILTGSSPYLAITNAPAMVANSVTDYTLGGIANTQVVGQIAWSNSLGGAGSIPAATNWEVTASLAVGGNLITVSGTNLLGETAVDQITIIRAADAPVLLLDKEFINATPPDATGNFQVTYLLNVHNAGGTESVYDLMDMPAPDPNVAILGGAFSGPAAAPLMGAGPYLLAQEMPIAAGTTHTYVLVLDAQLSLEVMGGSAAVSECMMIEGEYVAGRGLFNEATLAYGAGPFMVTANACGEVQLPMVDITTPDETVAHGTSSWLIEGLAANASGGITWTNSLTGQSGMLGADLSWSFLAPLGVGGNVISVQAANGAGLVVSDSVTIFRVPAPELDVTNENAVVRYSTDSIAVGGTIGAGIAGQLEWTNSLTGAAGSLAAVNPFEIAGIALHVGGNVITVRGTNPYGDVASDSVTIIRGDVGTDLPAVDITTPDQSVGNHVGSFEVSGTANLHVIGQMAWNNSLGGAGTFPAGSTWSFSAPLAVGVNRIAVTGTNLWGESATDEVVLTRDEAGLASVAVLKSAVPPGQVYRASGDVITYTLTLENTGDVAVHDPVMNDPQATAGPSYVSGDADMDGVLDVGETWAYSASYTITQADLDRGYFTNAATGGGWGDTDGDGAGDTPVEDTDEEVVVAEQHPNIAIVKTADPTTFDAVGDSIAYTLTMENTGNVTVYDPAMNDPQATAGPSYVSGDADMDGVLDVGETWVYSASYTITQADLDRGFFTNAGTGSGWGDTDGDGAGDTPVEDTDEEVVVADQHPNIAIVKTADPTTFDAVGDPIAYAFTVQNLGNVTLTNVMVFDPRLGLTLGPISLAPGASQAFNHPHAITLEDLAAGIFTNVATVTGQDPGGSSVEDHDEATVCRNLFLAPPPDLTLECTEDVGTNRTGSATAVSGCGCLIALTHEDVIDPGTCPQSYTLRRIWRAEDDCDNLLIHTQLITVVDTQAPVLPELPEGGDLGCNPVLPVCNDTLIALDNCAGEIPVVCQAGEVTGDGCNKSQVFAFTATDPCGNASTGTVAYTWTVDTDKPLISTEATSGNLGCNPMVAAPVFTGLDNCEGAFEPSVATDGPTNDGCAYSQTWTATYTDGCGNAADPVSITHIWTVDIGKPVINTTATDADLGCNPMVEAPVFTGMDNCEGAFEPSVATDGPTNDGCAYSQTWTATYADGCGNAADPVSITYTWKADITPPELPTLPVGGDLGINPMPPSCAEGLTASDDCDGAVPVVCIAGGISGVGNNKSQVFTYTAMDACGNVASDTVTYTWTVALMAPSDLAAVATGMSRIQLTWTDNNYYETGYAIERRSSSNAVWVALTTLPANTAAYEDAGLAVGQTYFYRIFAVNPDGTSPPSAEVSTTTPGVPAPPANLTAVAQATNQIELTWTDAADNETGFELQRKTGAAGAWSGLAALPANAQSHLDDGLAPNTLYYYRLRTTNAVGASAFTSEAGASTWPLPEDPDCTYEITVTATNLTADGSAISWPAVVPDNAVIGGTIGIRQTSPRSLGAVQRVAVGFRDLAGNAVGQPRELFLLQGVPGCPGRTLAALPLPTDLRAPAAEGSYDLWIESTISPVDPVIAFQSTLRTNLDNLNKKLGLFTVKPHPPGQVQVRFLPAAGPRSEPVMMQVLVNSTGGVNSVGFTVEFDPVIVANPRILPGADAPAIWPVVNTAMAGRLGVLLLLPDNESLPSGTLRLAEIWFDPVAEGSSALTFADVPVPREVAFVDPEVAPTVEWIGDVVTILMPGYEADLNPPPGGDFAVTEADVLMMQLLVAGIEPPASSNEYRKADCSPRGTSGNGRLDVSDLRQAIRYQNGLDPLQLEGGPSAPTNGVLSRGASLAALPKGESDRTLTAADQAVTRSETFWLAIELAAQGNESTLGFSLAFDPALLTYLDVRKVGAAGDATLVPSLNDLAEGRVGFALAMPGAEVLPAGKATILEVAFASAAGNQMVATPVGLTDSPVPRSCADVDAVPLPVAYAGATVTLQPIVAPGAPEVPTGLLAQATSTNQIHLAWNDASDNESGFQVLRRTGVQPWSPVAVLAPDVETYSDVGLAPGQSYRYQVEAFNGNGSGFSDEAEATTWRRMTAWRLAKFGTTLNEGDAADAGDWDEDGVPNQIEYGLGTDPLDGEDPASAWTMQVRDGVQIGTARFLTAIYELGPDAAPDMAVRMQLNANLLLPWTTFMLPVDDMPSGGKRRIRVRSDQPLDQRQQEYLRMNVAPMGN